MPVLVEDDVQWVLREDVPVFDSHIVVDKETGKEHRLDRERLQAIADRMNQRYETTGEESPITVGHTVDDKPEWEQPPIVGYAHDYYVAEHPKAGNAFLYARKWKLYQESSVGGERLSAEEIMRRYPRRSPEVWLSRNELDPIALLGATTPMRDLGMLRNARKEQPKKYAMGGSGVDIAGTIMALEALLQQLKGGMMPEDEGEAAIQQPAAEAGQVGPEIEENAAEEEPLDYGSDGGDENDATGDDESGDEEEKGPKKFQAACASSTNDFLPGDGSVEHKKKKPEDLERVKMQRDQTAIEKTNLERRFAAQQEELKKLRETVETDRMKYQREVRTGELKQLVAEGYALDVAEEIDDVALMDQEKYTKYVDRVRKRYSRVPVGEDFIRTAPAREGGPKAPSKELSQRAAEIASKQGKDFAGVLRMLQNGEM